MYQRLEWVGLAQMGGEGLGGGFTLGYYEGQFHERTDD